MARVAGGLRARGVKKGDSVAWQLPNCLAAAVLTRACWRIGAVAAPVLHSFGPADVERALGQVDPALVVDARPRRHLGSRTRWPTLLGHQPVPVGTSGVRPSDLAVILFTSGSTGTPKAVLHTHRGLSWKATLMAAGPRSGLPGRRPHAGTDGAHCRGAQRDPRPGCGRHAGRAGAPLRPGRGTATGGARADQLSGRPTHLLRGHGRRPGSPEAPDSTSRPSAWSRAEGPR